MIQRFVIEEFLKELCEKLEVTLNHDENCDCECWAEANDQDGGVISFVQDWLQEHKGEL